MNKLCKCFSYRIVFYTLAIILFVLILLKVQSFFDLFNKPLFFYDFVYGPNFISIKNRIRLLLINEALIQLILYPFFYILGFVVLEKILLIMSLFLNFYYMFKLLKHISKGGIKNEIVAYVFSLFFALSPVILQRFSVGHINLLIGNGFFIGFIYYLVFKQCKTHFKPVLLAFLTTLFSLHHLYFIVLASLIWLFINIKNNNTRKWIFTLLGWVILINIYIVLHFIVKTPMYTKVTQFSPRDIILFRPYFNNSFLWHIISAQGLWLEKLGAAYYLPPNPLSVLIFFIITLLNIIGIYVAINKRDKKIVFILILIIFALGIITIPLPIAQKVFTFVFLKPLREYFKFALIYTTGIVILSYWSINQLTPYIKYFVSILVSIFLIYILASLQMPVGSCKYPNSWYFLNRQPRGTVLILPLRSYAVFPFCNIYMLDPSERFFKHEITRYESDDVNTHSNNIILYKQALNKLKTDSFDYIVINKIVGSNWHDLLNFCIQQQYKEIYKDKFAIILKKKQ